MGSPGFRGPRRRSYSIVLDRRRSRSAPWPLGSHRQDRVARIHSRKPANPRLQHHVGVDRCCALTGRKSRLHVRRELGLRLSFCGREHPMKRVLNVALFALILPLSPPAARVQSDPQSATRAQHPPAQNDLKKKKKEEDKLCSWYKANYRYLSGSLN